MCDSRTARSAVLAAEAVVFGSKVLGTDDTPVKVLDPTLPHTRPGGLTVGDRGHPPWFITIRPQRNVAVPNRIDIICRRMPMSA
jgi:hypothetical protein